LLFFNVVFAYHVAPRTLNRLIEEADLIVEGVIVNPSKRNVREMIINDSGYTSYVYPVIFNPNTHANILVKDVLLGRCLHDSVKVLTNNFSNPRPAVYKDGEHVISFLIKSDSANFYRTVALSYGLIRLDSLQSAEWHKELISDYLPILEIRRNKKRKSAIASWLVKCCENPRTMWHGSYELNRGRYWFSYYDYYEDANYFKFLSDSSRDKLLQIALSYDTLNYHLLSIMDLIFKTDSFELRQAVLFNLQLYPTWLTTEIAFWYAGLLKQPNLIAIAKKMEDLDSSDESFEENMHLIVDKFLDSIK
jgi:hypothetical protein